MLAAFALWTMLVRFADVRAIGPDGSRVGLAAVNGFVHRITGVHMALYTATDYLSLVPIGFVCGFACFGLRQWIMRRSLLKVDRSILVLGGFYVLVLAVYILFEVCVVNYRPVLLDGVLEASYPSSTTVLVLCVMATARMQLGARIKHAVLRRCICFAITLFAALMIAGRIASGVHWFSDIVGGMLLSAGLVLIYSAVSGQK